MVGEWETVELGPRTRKIGSGATPRGGRDAYLLKGPFALVRSQNVLDFTFSRRGLAFINAEQAAALSNVEVRPEDILVNITGDSVARVCIVDPAILPARVNQHVAIIRANPAEFDQRFLFYSLVAPAMKQRLLSVASAGATRNALTKSDLEGLKITRPPFPVQQTIAHLLGSLDDKIKLNRRMASTLEAISRALFKSWFVDFDPVRVKAERGPTGLPDDLAALFPDSFQEDGLPVGWERRTLKPTLTRSIVRGISPAYAERGVLVVNQKCVRGGRLDLTKARRSDPTLKQVSEDRLLALGDVVINSTGVGTLGRVAQVRQTPEPLSADSHVTIVKPNENQISANLFGLALLELQPLIETLGHGSTGQTELSRDSVGELEIIIASKQVRHAFDEIVVPLLGRADRALAEAETLGELRDTLLPKLISGELRIADAQKRVSAA